MTRNFSALSLKPVWNCVTMRLQKPLRQLRGGWDSRAVAGFVELFIIDDRVIALRAPSIFVSLCAGRHRLFSASYAANYFAWCVGLLRRESAIFQHGLLARGLRQRASDSPFGRKYGNATELQAYLMPRGARRKGEVVWTFR